MLNVYTASLVVADCHEVTPMYCYYFLLQNQPSSLVIFARDLIIEKLQFGHK